MKTPPETPAHMLPGNRSDGKTAAVIYGRKCPICGDPLMVPRRGPRPTYCGTRCRVAAHRARPE